MIRDPKLVDLKGVVILHETENAYLIEYEGTKVWVPKSQVEFDEEDGTLTLPEWLAMEKELI